MVFICKINSIAVHIIRAQAAIKLVAFVNLLFFVPVFAQAAIQARYVQFGTVSRVVDGDTVWVQIGSHAKPLKVRIQGIDAPEICQSGGQQTQAALKGKILGQTVTVTSSSRDDFGRTVGMLHLHEQDIGRWMVSQGYAWVYSFRHKKGPYAGEFAAAQGARLGIFANAQTQEPREFRKANGSCRLSAYRPTS